jgi:hypothetical protein
LDAVRAEATVAGCEVYPKIYAREADCFGAGGSHILGCGRMPLIASGAFSRKDKMALAFISTHPPIHLPAY